MHIQMPTSKKFEQIKENKIMLDAKSTSGKQTKKNVVCSHDENSNADKSEPLIQNLTLNWYLINNQETDFAAIQKQPNKLYIIVTNKGKIRITIPVFYDTTDQITYFDAHCGLNGIISPNEIIAYAAFDLPNFVLQKVDAPAPSLLKQIYPESHAFKSNKFNTELAKPQIQERTSQKKNRNPSP